MFGFAVGLAYISLFEWAFHRYVFHVYGKRKGSFQSYHWHEHHKNSRANQMVDSDYELPVWGTFARGKEPGGILAGALLHLPLLPLAPVFTATVFAGSWAYYQIHKKAHLDPAWAREYAPWHVDHHLGPNQDANFGVTNQWWDILFDSRVPYVGTELETRDLERHAKRQTPREAAADPAGL